MVVAIYLLSIGLNFSIFSTYEAYQVALTPTNLYTNIETALIFIVPFLAITSNHIYWQIFPLGLLFDLALVGAYIAYLKKEWEYEKWAIVLIIGFLYLMFGSKSLTTYAPIPIVSRYFIILALPMAILTTRFVKGVYDYLHYNYKPLIAEAVICSFIIMAILIQFPMLYYFHEWIPTYTGAPIQNTTNTLTPNIIGRPG